jgi:hypothetical protein
MVVWLAPGGRSAVSRSRGRRPQTSRQADHGPRPEHPYQINEAQLQKEYVNFLRPPGHAQRFLSAFSGISPHFRIPRHLLHAQEYRREMANRFSIWNEVTGLTTAA